MIATVIAIIKSIFWLVVRFFKRKDEHEPQASLDKARTDAATGSDANLNADLDAAADRNRLHDRP